MQEEWRPIKGFEGLYEVSCLGNIRSVSRICKMKNGKKRFHRGRVLRPGEDGSGYLFVVLRKDGRNYNKKNHRAVAEAFVTRPEDEFCVVNHKDENAKNNRADNLEWCSERYNLNYMHRRTKETETRGTKVAQYSKKGELIAMYPSIGEASRKTGINRSSIGAILRYDTKTNFWGKPRTSGGYIWRSGKEVDCLWEKSRWRKNFLAQVYNQETKSFWVDRYIFKK